MVSKAALNNKVDDSMLTADISVEAQSSSKTSVLQVYRNFAKARNTSVALASGDMQEVKSDASSIGLWTRTSGTTTVFVAHNFGPSSASVSVSGYKMEDVLVSNGSVTVSGTSLTLGAYSSVVFQQ